MSVSDRRDRPISGAAAAQLREESTQNLSNLAAQLQELAVGSTWERSPEQSMSEYQLLDAAAESIDVLKAMNMRDRAVIESTNSRKLKEEEQMMRTAFRFRISPEEMEKTRNGMREVRARARTIFCVDDCMPTFMYGMRRQFSTEPEFVPELRRIEKTMDKVRATAIELQADNPDGHWAIDLLNFYSDGWMVWLGAFHRNIRHNWYNDIYDEEMEGAKQRAKIAEEIVEEVENER